MSAKQHNHILAQMEAGQILRPTWSVYYAIGVVYLKRIPAKATFKEIGNRFGMTKQNAHAETAVALGKLIYHLRLAVRENPCEL